MIPSPTLGRRADHAVYQRGLVIDSQLSRVPGFTAYSISKGIGD